MRRPPQEVANEARRLVRSALEARGYGVKEDTNPHSGRFEVLGNSVGFEVFVSGASGWGYPMWTERRLQPSSTRFVALVRFPDEGSAPERYLIPTLDWLEPEPPLVNPQYEGLNSEPEYGIRLSARAFQKLQRYRWTRGVENLPA